MERLYYTPTEVAARLGVSVDTVMRKIHADAIPALKVSERTYRIPIRAFELWEAGFVPPRRDVVIRPAEGKRWERIGEGEPLPEGAMSLKR